MSNAFVNIFGEPYAQDTDQTPSFKETMTSAFRLDNDLVNWYDMATKEQAPSDPNFNFDTQWQQAGKLPIEWKPLLARSTSAQDFSLRLGRIQQEEKDKAVLAASGWGGTFSALAAGVVSPTIFLPFVGQARGVAAVGQAFAWAAAAATAQEAPLYFNQQTRTEAESLGSIALGTLLGGVMGSAYGLMRPVEREALEASFASRSAAREMPDGPLDLGYAVRKSEVVPELRQAQLREHRNISASELAVRIRGTDENLAWLSDEKFDLPVATYKQLAEVSRGEAASDATLAKDELVKVFGDEAAQVSDPVQVLQDLGKVYDNSGVRFAEEAVGAEKGLRLSEALAEVDRLKGTAQQVDGMVPELTTKAIPSTELSGLDAAPLSAAARVERNTRGVAQATGGAKGAAMRAFGRMSPLFRMAMNKVSPTLRDAAFKLGDGGLQQAGLDVAEGSALGGSVSARVAFYDVALSDFMTALDKAYTRYIFGDVPDSKIRDIMAQARSAASMLPEGKMKFPEFSEAVYDGLVTGQMADGLGDSVNAFRKFFATFNDTHKRYLAELRARGLDVRPLYRELEDSDFEKGIIEYAHQVYDGTKIEKDPARFDEVFGDWIKGQLDSSFASAREKFAKRQAELQARLDYAQLSPAEKEAAYASLEDDLTLLRESPEYSSVAQERQNIRKEMLDEGYAEPAIRQAVKAYEDGLDGAQAEALAAYKAGRRKLLEYKKLGGGATARADTLAAAIDKIDASVEGELRGDIGRLAKQAAKIEAAVDNRIAELAKAEAAVAKTLKTLAARQEKMLATLKKARSKTSTRSIATIEAAQAAKLKYDAALASLTAAKGKDVALAERISNLNLQRELAIKDTSEMLLKRGARKAELEDKLAAETAASAVVEEGDAVARAELYKTMMFNREQDFEQLWRERGAVGTDLLAGEVDFSEQAAKEALYLRQQLTGGRNELIPAGMIIRQGERGAQLTRALKIPYAMKREFLIRDAETVARAYLRQMGPDLEIWRAFDGSVNGASVVERVRADAFDLRFQLQQSNFVKLPAGWANKADDVMTRVRDNLELPSGSEDLFVDASNFSLEAKPGFTEITPELRQKLNDFINTSEQAGIKEFDASIQRLRHTRMVPQDSNSLMWRSGRALKDLNVMTMMGMVPISSLADVAMPVLKYGFAKTFAGSWKNYMESLAGKAVGESGRSFRVASREVNRKLALNLEPQLHGRAQAILDIGEAYAGGKTYVERAIRFGANKMGLVAMFDYWTAGMKGVAAAATHATLATYVPEVAKAIHAGGAMSDELVAMRTKLRSLGLRDTDIIRIDAMMAAPGGMEKFSNGAELPNFDAWQDVEAYRAYGAAVKSDVDSMIITPGLERPLWTDENMAYSMVAQFRSFTFASNSRVTMAMLQGNQPYLIQGSLMALAMGAISYYTYANVVGGKTRDKANKLDPEDWLYQAVDRSGLLGAISLGQKVGEQIPMLNQYAVFGGKDMPYRRGAGLLGSIFGPSVSQAQKVSDLVMNIDDPAQRDENLKRIRQVFIPYQNVAYLRHAFDALAAAIGE